MPAQTAPSFDELLRVVNVATDRKALRWNTTADEDSFRAVFDMGMVRISMVPESPCYLLVLLDRDGTLLDQFRPSGDSEVGDIAALFEKARRQALDVDGKLHRVFIHLKTLAGES